MSMLMDLLKSLPALKKSKNPTLAAIIGFLFGGIGLGIFFLSFTDFVLPILVVIILAAVLKAAGWIVGAAFAGLYGFVRASESNRRLAEPEATKEAV